MLPEKAKRGRPAESTRREERHREFLLVCQLMEIANKIIDGDTLTGAIGDAENDETLRELWKLDGLNALEWALQLRVAAKKMTVDQAQDLLVSLIDNKSKNRRAQLERRPNPSPVFTRRLPKP